MKSTAIHEAENVANKIKIFVIAIESLLISLCKHSWDGTLQS
jgi:hypothetical protein